MRSLFVRLLNMNTMSNPYDVWLSCWKLLADGILYNRRRELNLPGNQIFIIIIIVINIYSLCIIYVVICIQIFYVAHYGSHSNIYFLYTYILVRYIIVL
jgi:hypothetical protein